GLQAWSERGRGWVELALLLPNMIPPLFLSLGLLNLAAPFGAFPYGLGAVVAAHILLNMGLVAVAFDRLVHSRLGALSETAWVLGVKSGAFWRRIAWPLLRADVGCLFLFVFSVCFTSFSIPLLLGGERGVTLEVAIHDAVRIEGRWDKAVLFAAFQSLMLFVFAWLLPQPFWPPQHARQGLRFLAWPRLKYLTLAPFLLIALGWFLGTVQNATWPDGLQGTLIPATITTVLIAVSVGFLHLLLFLAIAFVTPHARLNRFLNGYLAPSPVITGFGLLLLPGAGELIDMLKLVAALTLISLPLLYRWIVHSALAGLHGQIRVARLLGAGWSQLLFEIVVPQVALPVARAAGLAALWACGDFALTSILASDVQTLPLVMESLIGNYRMEAAQILMYPLMLVGLSVYALFVNVGRYVSR
ncbi:MAG TPA: hypothetical protein PKC28_10265, partial [Bdellovibrionales bacterium]|nr:hypothetical protein [Bdellovibrionales bacterium]